MYTKRKTLRRLTVITFLHRHIRYCIIPLIPQYTVDMTVGFWSDSQDRTCRYERYGLTCEDDLGLVLGNAFHAVSPFACQFARRLSAFDAFVIQRRGDKEEDSFQRYTTHSSSADLLMDMFLAKPLPHTHIWGRWGESGAADGQMCACRTGLTCV